MVYVSSELLVSLIFEVSATAAVDLDWGWWMPSATKENSAHGI